MLWPEGGNDTKAAGMVDGAREEWSGVDGNMAVVLSLRNNCAPKIYKFD